MLPDTGTSSAPAATPTAGGSTARTPDSTTAPSRSQAAAPSRSKAAAAAAPLPPSILSWMASGWVPF